MRVGFKPTLSWLLDRILPDRGKRSILVSSLYAHICGTAELDGILVSKLNNLMQLSYHDDALGFPFHLHKLIWKNVDINLSQVDKVQNNDFDDVIKNIMAQIPKWLKYSTDDKIKDDICQLFQNRKQLAF